MKNGARFFLGVFACVFLMAANGDEIPATGLIDADPAAYAALPKRQRTRGVVLVDKIDLSRYFPTPGHQKTQGSCSAWAVGYAVRSYYFGAQRNAPPEGPEAIVSPASIFNQTNPTARGLTPECGGVNFPDTFDYLKNFGARSLADAPYDPTNCRPPPQIASDPRFRIPGYSTIGAADLRDVRRYREALAKGHPVVVAMRISINDYWNYKAGEIYKSAAIGPSPHGMVVAGFDDEKHAFLLFNSWGPAWGENGKMWIDYDTFLLQVREAYLIEGLPPPPAVLDLVAARAPQPSLSADDQLKALVASVKCGRLRLEQRAQGRALVGQVGPDEADAVRALARRIDPSIGLEFEELSWPACEAAKLLTAQTTTNGLDVKVLREDGKDTGGAFVEGDKFYVSINVPQSAPYLEVFYLQADRTAKELFRGEAPVGPNGARSLKIGAGSMIDLKTAAPFGPEAVVVVAGPAPLSLGQTAFNSSEHDFLKRLGDAMIQSPGAARLSRIVPVQALGATDAASRWLILQQEVVSFAENAGAEATMPKIAGPPSGALLDVAWTIGADGRGGFRATSSDPSVRNLRVQYRVANGWVDLGDRISALGVRSARSATAQNIRLPSGAHLFRVLATGEAGVLSARENLVVVQ
jgi:hypothetical protein